MENLTVGDGFRFGCGFMLAALVAGVLYVIAIIVIMFVLTAIGIAGLPDFPTP